MYKCCIKYQIKVFTYIYIYIKRGACISIAEFSYEALA